MIYETHKIIVPYEEAGLSGDDCEPTITVYRTQVRENDIDSKRLYPAVLICPGGGYDYCSPREGEPVAVRFAAYGVVSFVLNYSVGRKPFPTALLEAGEAIAFIRRNSEKYRVDPNKITIMGFSAGGHLAASLCVHYESPNFEEILGYKNGEHIPNAAVLCYPVITTGPLGHQGSIANLIDPTDDPEMQEIVLSNITLENHVSHSTPPTFIWHNTQDETVSIFNSLRYIQMLAAYNVPFEAALYPGKAHGLSLADPLTSWREDQIQPNVAGWFDKALALIQKAGF
jgi:acetyl esterase/lipase